MRGQTALLERRADASALRAVVPVHELSYEHETQSRLAGWLGSIALEQTIHMESLDVPEQTNLAQLVAEAKTGDEQALAAVRMNAHTTVIETLLKTGNVIRIEAEVAPHGGLKQHGHTYDSIHRNSMRGSATKAPAIRRRTEIEALNWQRTEAAIAHGDLDDNWLVTFSLPPESMSISDMKKEGFFVHTMTAVIQASTVHADRVVTESGFVGGMQPVEEVPDASDEQNNYFIANAARNRYDLAAVRGMYYAWGVENAHVLSTEDLLAMPLLIPKSMMPHGVSSLAELYDTHLGQEYFYGLRQPKQPYATFAETCATKARQYNSITEAVVGDLLDAAATLQGKPEATVALLYERAQFHALERAFRDKTIDASVFGAKGKYRTERARAAYDNNDIITFMREASLGHKEAVTTACGGGAGADKKSEGNTQAGSEGGGSGGGIGAAGLGADKGGEVKLKWRSGYCRIDKNNCPERGKLTLVAQCDVCIKCQFRYFDKGLDPTKFSKSTSLFTQLNELSAVKS